MQGASSEPALSAHGLGISVATRQLVSGLSLEFVPGELVAVLGRNGSGKTLTLHTLAGLRQPAAGKVLLGSRPLEELGRRAIARHVGVLAQDAEEGLTATVLETVLVGRHPHLGLLEWERASDRSIALECLTRVGLDGFAERTTETLSGGEHRRMAIAALLAQDPEVFLLDEPTNHLDPQHQLAVMTLFGEMARRGRTVVATLHDATLAARFADRAVLLFGDGRWRAGPAAEVLTAEALGELYRTPMLEVNARGRRVFVGE